MADGQKLRDLPEGLVEGEVTAHDHDSTLKPEVSSSSSPTSEEPVSAQSPSGQLHPGLLSMPCLLKELSRDSMPDAPPPTMGSIPSVIQLCPQEDSDSSACLRSPTSSGHLGDSDTLSSAEEEGREMGEAGLAPASCCDPAPRKSSRRSRSESDATAGVGMAAKKNRCQEKQPNGTRSRGRGQRSQRQKERMRMLRQKREAAAKRKPRTLQDSSTSDSDATAHSSSSASSDRARDSIYLHPAAGRCGNSVSGILEEALTRVVAVQRRTEERFRAWMERISHLHADDNNGNRTCDGSADGRSHVGPQEAGGVIRQSDDATPPSLNTCILDPNVVNM